MMSPIWVAHTNNVRHGNNNAHIVAHVNASTNAARQQDSTTSILRNSQPPPRGENKNCNDNNNKIDASGVKRLIPCMSFCS